MKKTEIKKIAQILIGVISVLLLWCVGAFAYEYAFMSFEDVDYIFHVLPGMVIILMPVLLMVYAVVGKRNGLKALYFSAVISVWVPVLAFILSHFFSDDGNILCWVYGLTLGMVFYPFHRLAWSTFDGVWLGSLGYNPEFCAFLLVVSIILSFIIYKLVKTRTKSKRALCCDNDNSADFLSEN